MISYHTIENHFANNQRLQFRMVAFTEIVLALVLNVRTSPYGGTFSFGYAENSYRYFLPDERAPVVLSFSSIAKCSNVSPGIFQSPDHRFDRNLPTVIGYLVDLLGPSEPASDLYHA